PPVISSIISFLSTVLQNLRYLRYALGVRSCFLHPLTPTLSPLKRGEGIPSPVPSPLRGEGKGEGDEGEREEEKKREM
ncbi:MAG: hypothetical protein NC905_02915, partial [Candidatus Omnitrophica bacterium]|nr:hypothetical protein [Candidatus Omnitrophota bacterium]